MSASSMLDTFNMTIENNLKNAFEKGIKESSVFQSILNNEASNNANDKVDKLENEIKNLRENLTTKGDFTKRLETEVYCLKNMIDTTQINTRADHLSRSEFKSDYLDQNSKRHFSYDMSRISNPKDNEQILCLSEEIEFLLRDNILKDKQISETEKQIERYDKVINEDYLSISELNHQKKLDQRETEELKMKLNLLERKLQRLSEFNKRKELENFD